MRKPFTCKCKDLTIFGYEYRKSDEVLPAVILSHGFLASHSMCSPYAELAESHGFVAFSFDFNGGGVHSKSTGKSKKMTVLSEVDDLRAVLQYVRTLPNVDTTRIFLLGCSQGGLVSALVAKELQREIAGLILLYPALCIPDDARRGHMLFSSFDPNNIPPIILRFPMKLGGDYAKTVMDWDVYERIKGYDGPTLLLHGDSDKIVDLSYAQKAVSCYPKIEFHVISNGAHMFKGKADEEAKRYILDFLKKESRTYTFEIGTREDALILFNLVKLRIEWMNENGIRHWNCHDYLNVFPYDYYLQQSESGHLFKVMCEGEVAAAGILFFDVDERWGNDSDKAIYIHNLASDLRYKGAGRAFIYFVVQKAKKEGISFVRLDCDVDDEKLNQYYDQMGFVNGMTFVEGPYHGIQKELKVR